MAKKIELIGSDAWTATQEDTVLGDLVGMEIAKHIWDSRHASKITGFEYARSRGTRNMMNPTPPALVEPRGKTRVSAWWSSDMLMVRADCEGRSDGDDRLVVTLQLDRREVRRFECSADDVNGEPAWTLETRADGWSAVLSIPWPMLGVHPRPGMDMAFNVVRSVDWTDVDPPEMLSDGFLVNGMTRVTAGLEVSTLSRSVRYPTVQDPLQADRFGTLVLSPPLEIDEVVLLDAGLMEKHLTLSLSPVREMPDRVDLLVTLVDPRGREVSFVDRVASRGHSTVVLPYLFGVSRGFLYPYRLHIVLSDPETGITLSRRTCRFLPPDSIRLDPLQLGHEQRGTGSFRLAATGLAETVWQAALVNDGGRELDRGQVIPASDDETFQVEIGEVPRGRYRLRLRPVGLDRTLCVECPCNVMGVRQQPSVMLRWDNVERLRGDVRRGGLRPHYERLKRGVDAVLERGTLIERSWTPDGVERREIALDDEFLASDALLMQGFGEDTLSQRNPHAMMAVALVYLIEGDVRYGEAAKRMVQVLVDHVLWGDPRVYGADPDLMWKAMFCALVVDWLGNLYSPEERRAIRDSLVQNGMMVYLRSMENDTAPWKGSITNLTPLSNGVAAALALVFRDEVLEAEDILSLAREDVQTPLRAMPPDGSWPESVNYWGVFLHGVVFYGAVLESATGSDDGVFSLPGVKNAGSFPIYFTPRGVPAGWNDGMTDAALPFLHLLARRTDATELSLYADAYGGSASDPSDSRSDWTTLLWRSPEIDYLEPVEPTEVGDRPAPPALASRLRLGTLKVYEEIRWAAMASSWPHPELYVSFKSGYSIEGFGHTSLDLSAIQVIAGGEPLIRRSHNYRTPPEGYSTVLIDGEAQRPATGTFLYWEEGERYRVIAAEADRSFGEKVRRVRRHVVMVDGRYLVVLDEVEADAPVSVTSMAHTAGKIRLHEGRCDIAGVRTNLSLVFASPEVQLNCVDPPACVMTQLTDRAVHATTRPARRTELVTVVWPTEAELEAPECRWAGEQLEVERPDGGRDVVAFVRAGEGLRLVGVE